MSMFDKDELALIDKIRNKYAPQVRHVCLRPEHESVSTQNYWQQRVTSINEYAAFVECRAMHRFVEPAQRCWGYLMPAHQQSLMQHAGGSEQQQTT